VAANTDDEALIRLEVPIFGRLTPMAIPLKDVEAL
jgi:hypothetical protein